MRSPISALRDSSFAFAQRTELTRCEPDLDDAAGGFAGFDHFEAVRRGVGHGLFAVDVFAGMDGIDDDLLVPMVGNGRR